MADSDCIWGAGMENLLPCVHVLMVCSCCGEVTVHLGVVYNGLLLHNQLRCRSVLSESVVPHSLYGSIFTQGQALSGRGVQH